MTERDIAIVGMSGAFPGAPNLGAYWDSICAGRVHFQDIPIERWDHSAFFSRDPRDTDTTYASKIACLDDIRSFAPERFKMPPRRVRAMDPQQRLMLDQVRLAMDDAGYGGRPLPRSTGVYIGASVAEFKDLVVSRLRARQLLGGEWGSVPPMPEKAAEDSVENVAGIQQYSMLGVLLNMIACNVSEAFDLSGPALVMDAACSSALVALHEAVLHLRNGICDAAIVGGVYTICTPDLLVGFSRIGALSRSDVCRPFDANADGFVLGEGVGAVILKRLDEAVRDNDRIWAVIKGVGMNNDGRGDGPMTPRLSGQTDALARAYRDARVSPDTVHYVEAHGTATPVGDATEMAALRENAKAMGEGNVHCAVTSVKGNIGHPLAASGIAGLIKAVLVLTHGVGPMRKYSIGAFLLDLQDPARVIGRLREPLLSPEQLEREVNAEELLKQTKSNTGGPISSAPTPYDTSSFPSNTMTPAVAPTETVVPQPAYAPPSVPAPVSNTAYSDDPIASPHGADWHPAQPETKVSNE